MRALSNIRLRIHAGEFVAVMGPSGSGKTTLMNIIGCLDRPSTGEYYFEDRPVHTARANELSRLRREVFGFVFQNYNLLAMATARENVEIPAIYAGTPKRVREARAEELLSAFGLSSRIRHQPRELSGGEQQRVAIARALINGGRVLLADEPTGSLDSRSGRGIMSHLNSLSAQGHTVIVVTHDASVAANAGRLIHLLDGRIVEDSEAKRSESVARVSGLTKRKFDRNGGIRAQVMSLQENCRTAFRVLKSNRSRTVLTMMGIIIGVFSVLAMLGLAEGVRRAILDNFGSLGATRLTLTPSRSEDAQSAILTIEDAEAIRKQIPHLVSVLPQMSGGGMVVGSSTEEFALIKATTSLAMKANDRRLAQGMFFTRLHEENYAPVVVLGSRVTENLFDDSTNPLGEHVLIGGSLLQVIGVLQRPQGSLAAFNSDAQAVFVPLMTGGIRLFGRENLNSIEVLVADIRLIEAAQMEIAALLTRRHGIRDFEIQNQQEVLKAQNNVAITLKLLFGAIGSISLLVAGIGVMNIMLATVAERTREIGLRMATGARRRDILFQFVCEAVVVSGLGGLVGLFLALGIGEAINLYGITIVVFTPPILLTGLSCATLTGFIFGFAPAKRAARMNPVAALAAH